MSEQRDRLKGSFEVLANRLEAIAADIRRDAELIDNAPLGINARTGKIGLAEIVAGVQNEVLNAASGVHNLTSTLGSIATTEGKS